MIRPPEFSFAAELFGVVRALVTLPVLARGWRRLPRGGGAPVLVLPGYMAGDGSTHILRWYLGSLGYRTHGWGLGRNRGNVNALVPRMAERVAALAEREGRALRLIGWSLGGVVAREAARARPDAVDRIVTLGTPVIGGPKYTMVASAYRRRGVDLDRLEREIEEVNAVPLPVPVTSIYSKRDGVVAWRASIDPNPKNRVEHVEVDATHSALGIDAKVLRIVARALAADADDSVS